MLCTTSGNTIIEFLPLKVFTQIYAKLAQKHIGLTCLGAPMKKQYHNYNVWKYAKQIPAKIAAYYKKSKAC